MSPSPINNDSLRQPVLNSLNNGKGSDEMRPADSLIASDSLSSSVLDALIDRKSTNKMAPKKAGEISKKTKAKRPARNNKQQHLTPASDQVLAIPELLEQILTHLSGATLVKLKGVSHTFRNVINGSTMLKEVPFVQPEDVIATRCFGQLTLLVTPRRNVTSVLDIVTVNPNLFEEVTDLRTLPENDSRVFVPRFSLWGPGIVQGLGQYFSHMYLTFPPINSVRVTYTYIYPDGIDRRGRTITNPNGLQYWNIMYELFQLGENIHSWEITFAPINHGNDACGTPAAPVGATNCAETTNARV